MGGRSDSQWVQDKARRVPWSPQQRRAAGMWSRGLHVTPQFPRGSTELPIRLLLPWSSLAGFPHPCTICSGTQFLSVSTIALLNNSLSWISALGTVDCLAAFLPPGDKPRNPWVVKSPLMNSHWFPERPLAEWNLGVLTLPLPPTG